VVVLSIGIVTDVEKHLDYGQGFEDGLEHGVIGGGRGASGL